MNKKEINEIRKNFTNNCDYMYINSIVTAYITAEKEIGYIKKENPALIDEETLQLIIAKLGQVFKGQIGKTLIELNVNKTTDDGVKKSKFIDNIVVNKQYYTNSTLEDYTEYVQYIVDNYDGFVGAYTIFIATCDYSVLNKNTEETESYKFNIGCICPVNLKFNGLICTNEPKIEKDANLPKVVEDPVQGWLYPVFNERCADSDYILYSAKSTKLVDKSFINNVLDCEYISNPEEQKEIFENILTSAIGDSLNYDTLTDINNVLINKLENTMYETEPLELDKASFLEILDDIGIEESTIDNVSKVWDKKVEEEQTFNTNVLATSKNTMTSNDFKITYSNESMNKIGIKTVDNRKCIVIEIDDTVELNGIPIQN